MNEWVRDIEQKAVWSLANLATGTRQVAPKWVFQIKNKDNGIFDRYKARLVAKCLQRPGTDFGDICASVIKYSTPRLVLEMFAIRHLKIFQIDASSAFLNEDLKEYFYVAQRRWFEHSGSEEKVLILSKALYRHLKASQAWNGYKFRILTGMGFIRKSCEESPYNRTIPNANQMPILAYVDDMFLTGDDHEKLRQIAACIEKQVDWKLEESMNKFLGMHFDHDSNAEHLTTSK